VMYADIHRRCQTIGDKLHTRVIQHRAPPSIHLQYRLLVPIRPEQLVLHRIQQPVKPICVKEKHISVELQRCLKALEVGDNRNALVLRG